MLLNDKRINLEIDKTRISGIFTFEESSTLTIFCLDENFIPNLNPTQYTLLKINDNPPLLSINLPFNEFEIDESYEININMNIMDDYGIHDAYIEYNILSPEYFSTNRYPKCLRNFWDPSTSTGVYILFAPSHVCMTTRLLLFTNKEFS